MKIKFKPFLKKAYKPILIGIIAALFAGALYAVAVVRSVPDVTLLSQNRIAESTKLYDRTGKVLLYELYGEQRRTVVAPNQIPDIVRNATIAVEDRNFYNHAAIDWKGVTRAMLTNIRNAGVVQGGSTITQQLAKKAFLTDDRTISRKIKELVIAYNLEKRYSKDEILNLYLNQIPYGANAYGIEAASKTYFGKSAIELTVAETALLASLPKAPSYYSPWGTHVADLIARKNRTIGQMAEAGFLTEEQKNKALKEEITFLPQFTNIKAPHFVMLVQEYLSNAYGDDFMRTGGLKVTTTLDWALQQAAEKAVADGAKRNTELYKGTNAALVAADSETGQVLTLVGSRGYFDETIDGNFDVASQGLRQPGSSIKPFAYLAAFKKGFSPDTVLFDAETEFDTTGVAERSYKPQNFDHQFRGPVSMRNSLAQSVNVTSVKTLYLAGIDNVLTLVRAMGISTLNERNRYGLTLALGGGEVKLIDMIKAYSVLSQDGVLHEQATILSVEDKNGKTLESYKDAKEQVVSSGHVRMVNDILSDTAARSPLFQSSMGLTIFPNHEVAMKTGTTNDYRDAWTFGYTPSLVVGVWAGNNDNKPLQQSGGSILAAVPIWSAFMKEALKNAPFEPFPRPNATTADKPVLNGEYIVNNEVHTILYYVNKKDPLGPPPQNPQADSQFKNWEEGIISWLNARPDFLMNRGGMNMPSTSGIELINIKNGDFVLQSPFTVNTRLTAATDIIGIETYLNDVLVRKDAVPPNKSYDYSVTVAAPLEAQNKFAIKIFGAQGILESKEIVIFKR
ncbi:MAG: transglycosylase domain-containing protein [bacterium]|nr:transglycosylase domain-containing protein [bacterium]